MDPTDAELNNMATLQHVADWAGTTGEVHEQLMDALGKPSKLRDIAFINRTVWDNVVAGLKIDTSSGTTTSERDLTPVEASRIEIFRRVTLLRLGANPDHVGSSTAPPVVSIGVSPLPSTSTPTSPTRKLKLSSVIDPTLDAEIIQLEQSEVARMYSTYKAKFGDHPSQEVEPSADQLSGINQMLRSGALPYCDFSVFGPHGLRQLRKAVFTSYVLNVATGEWSKREAPGPDSIFNWEKSFRTFKTALLLLEAAESERLDAYADHIKELHGQFGHECWGIIYRADVRMRSEFQDRIRRALDENPNHGYTRASPWSAVFAQAVKEGDFWTKEVVTPATLLLARNKSLPARQDGDSSDSDRGGKKVRPDQPPKKKKRKYAGEDLSHWDGQAGAFSLNRKGIQICQKFNRNQCGNGKAQSRCPNNRSHQCNLCLGPHMATKCTGGKRQKS